MLTLEQSIEAPRRPVTRSKMTQMVVGLSGYSVLQIERTSQIQRRPLREVLAWVE